MQSQRTGHILIPRLNTLIELFLLYKAATSRRDKWRQVSIKVISYKVQKGIIVEFVRVQTQALPETKSMTLGL